MCFRLWVTQTSRQLTQQLGKGGAGQGALSEGFPLTGSRGTERARVSGREEGSGARREGLSASFTPGQVRSPGSREVAGGRGGGAEWLAEESPTGATTQPDGEIIPAPSRPAGPLSALITARAIMHVDRAIITRTQTK